MLNDIECRYGKNFPSPPPPQKKKNKTNKQRNEPIIERTNKKNPEKQTHKMWYIRIKSSYKLSIKLISENAGQKLIKYQFVLYSKDNFQSLFVYECTLKRFAVGFNYCWIDIYEYSSTFFWTYVMYTWLHSSQTVCIICGPWFAIFYRLNCSSTFPSSSIFLKTKNLQISKHI